MLTTVNELGNYIAKRISFLLKEKPEYKTEYIRKNSHLHGLAKKHTHAYFTKAQVHVEYIYEWRKVNIVYYDITYVKISFSFYEMSFYKEEYIDNFIENLLNMISPI